MPLWVCSGIAILACKRSLGLAEHLARGSGRLQAKDNGGIEEALNGIRYGSGPSF
jgi:hypothetical protein